MKILHLCLGNFFIDNYSYQENMLPKYHIKQGHDVLVIASLFTYDVEGKGTFLPSAAHYKDNNGFDIIRLEYKKPIFWNRFFRHYQGLAKAINDFSPDVIFSHNVSYGDTTVVGEYLKKHPNVRLFADNHGDYINSAQNWCSKHILHPVIWRHYSKVIEPYMVRCYGVTPMRCRFLREMYHVNPNIVEYLPLGVDDDLIPLNRGETRQKVRMELGVGENELLMVTGGKIGRLKNTHVLLEAMEKLNNPNLHLIICGVLSPEMGYLKEIIDKNPVVHYLGWCDSEKVMNCMVASDLACFPGTHSTLWEQAVGVGIPAIFKRWDEMEHVNVNNNCIFVKGEDVEELVNVLKTLSYNKDKYNQLKKAAETAAKSFLYSEIAKKAIE